MGYIYMLVFFFFLTANCEEQLCSRFHYEQMTLEKMIRQEMNFEKIRGEIEDELLGMKKEIADLKSESEMLKKAPVVIVHATNLRNLEPADGETLVFTNALTNDGAAYNAANGRFTAPLNGTYAFTVQLCMRSNNGFFQYEIVKSTGDALVRSQLSSRVNYYDCHSASVYAFLKTGESVWVKASSRRGNLVQTINVWNIFSGVLLNKI